MHQKKLGLNCHVGTWLERKQKGAHRSSLLHMLSPKTSSSHPGIITSSARMTIMALSSSPELKITGFHLPSQMAPTGLIVGVFDLSLHLLLSLS